LRKILFLLVVIAIGFFCLKNYFKKLGFFIPYVRGSQSYAILIQNFSSL
jgi:uncharacterized protein YxeA